MCRLNISEYRMLQRPTNVFLSHYVFYTLNGIHAKTSRVSWPLLAVIVHNYVPPR